jgi:hypothetical protein
MNRSNSQLFQLKYKLVFSFLLLITTSIRTSAQADSTYSIFVAGHAYGAHVGTNIGLHPPFLAKLKTNNDSTVKALILTGDIVNQSISASWSQVENELLSLGLSSYYVMGNHDNNPLGLSVFKKKYGSTYYSFTLQNELYIILNSTESDRSISPVQLQFLDQALKQAGTKKQRIFIFFHEVIWNSIEKYRLVRSNSRSRYEYMVNISNFWNQVFPLLNAYQEKKFYVFAGDVGGNPDAIAASYDRWGNVTLISSGMGEVRDENFLRVNILKDTVTFQLIPLNDEVMMHPITWYNIPEKPLSINGPATVFPPVSSVGYEVAPISNATSYRWILIGGISGSSDSSSITMGFNQDFQTGKIVVSAVNDGFGESESVVADVHADNTMISEKENASVFMVVQDNQSLQLTFNSESSMNAQLRIFDQMGRLILNDHLLINSGENTKTISKSVTEKGLIFIELLAGKRRMIQKILVN